MSDEYVIQTNQGQKTMTDLTSTFMLNHEYVQHQVSEIPAKQLSLKTYKAHLESPYNLVNTSITATLLLHELQYLNNKIVIVDYSNKTEFDQLFSHIIIIKAFKILVKHNLTLNEKNVYYSVESCYKSLELEFNLSKFRPMLIGEINICDIDIQNQFEKNNIIACFQFSRKYGCPVVLNCISSKFSQTIFGSVKQVTAVYDKLINILQLAKELEVTQNIIVFNLLFVLKINYHQDMITKMNLTVQYINTVRSFATTIGYDLLRYNQQPDFSTFISQEILKYPDNTILSAGVLFKTDMQDFGGEGFQASKSKARLNATASIINKVCGQNLLRRLCWRKRQTKIVQIMYWKCQQCKLDFQQTVQKFKKFGLLFCSTTCIRKHKF